MYAVARMDLSFNSTVSSMQKVEFKGFSAVPSSANNDQTCKILLTVRWEHQLLVRGGMSETAVQITNVQHYLELYNY